MKFLKYLRFWEVKFSDWLWFVFVLKCNEFSPKLNMHWMASDLGPGYINNLVKLRDKAHRIDAILSA